MLYATVQGTATSTIKHRSLEGWRLLVIQPYAADGTTPDGEPLLAIDRLGAGIGANVIVTSDGRMVRELMQDATTPVRWSVLGLADPPGQRSASRKGGRR